MPTDINRPEDRIAPRIYREETSSSYSTLVPLLVALAAIVALFAWMRPFSADAPITAPTRTEMTTPSTAPVTPSTPAPVIAPVPTPRPATPN